MLKVSLPENLISGKQHQVARAPNSKSEQNPPSIQHLNKNILKSPQRTLFAPRAYPDQVGANFLKILDQVRSKSQVAQVA